MKEKYRKVNYVVFNDDVAIFGLFKVAKSYGFLEEIGYIYNWAVPNSETHNYGNKDKMNAMFKCCFATMEYLYEQTENNLVEKRAGLSFFLINPVNFFLFSLNSFLLVVLGNIGLILT